MMADGFDLLNASIAGPALIKEWGISRAALGPVFSASLVGFFVGAPFFGYLGDRFGRRLASSRASSSSASPRWPAPGRATCSNCYGCASSAALGSAACFRTSLR
jgi:MFS family permease